MKGASRGGREFLYNPGLFCLFVCLFLYTTALWQNDLVYSKRTLCDTLALHYSITASESHHSITARVSLLEWGRSVLS